MGPCERYFAGNSFLSSNLLRWKQIRIQRCFHATTKYLNKWGPKLGANYHDSGILYVGRWILHFSYWEIDMEFTDALHVIHANFSCFANVVHRVFEISSHGRYNARDIYIHMQKERKSVELHNAMVSRKSHLWAGNLASILAARRDESE